MRHQPTPFLCSGEQTSSDSNNNNNSNNNNSSTHVYSSTWLQTLPRATQPIRSPHQLKFGLFNTRSLNNKGLIINQFISDNKLDFFCITETWQKPMEYFALNQTAPPGYTYLDRPRENKTGGGIATIHRQSIKTTTLSIPSASSFEHLAFKLSGPKPLVTAVIYCPPPLNPAFPSDLSEFLTQLCAISPSVLLLGDFNIHVDSNCRTSAELLDILHCFNITQHVDFPTHTGGHTLDLVCTSGVTINNLTCTDLAISDHLTITLDIDIPTPLVKQKRIITYRNLKSINPSSFSSTLADTIPENLLTSAISPAELVNTYNNVLSSCLDQTAPTKSRTVSFTHSAPWYTDHLRHLKAKGRQLERLHKKTGLSVHLDAYKLHQQHYKEALNTARSSYYSSIIDSGHNNPKTLFSTINKLLKPMDTISNSFTTSKCNSFISFFQTKIETIHNQLTATSPTSLPDLEINPPRPPSHPLTSFSPITDSDLSSTVASMKSSTSALDPIPSSLVKACLPTLAPLITSIVNSSLSTGAVPPAFKLAAVTPILKKPGLDPDVPNNYRPISNLPFLSKVLERVVATQLKSHLNSNDLYEPFQSGFRSKHSTETALLKITNDILLSADSGHLSILLLLDLSAAFDTINHSILLNRLQYSIGITGTALSWFRSYLSDRQQYISINNCKSPTAPVTHGVPQGSVLGPLLFILYILPLGQILRRHGLRFHCYADDTQLYLSSKTISTTTHSTLSSCLSDLKSWMQQNYLKLNCDKSEILIIGPDSLTRSTQSFSLNIDGSTVTPSKQVRNLGIILDPKLSFLPHVNQVTKSAFFHLRNIARIRPSLSFSAAETLTHAFITSRLDYCNSILFGLPNYILNKLQYVQNSAARLLTSTRRRDHITPVLQNLHWLPVKQRIEFKVLLTTYKAINGLAPSYLTDLIPLGSQPRCLRSADFITLETRRTRLCTWGDRAFSAAAPSLWNALPSHIRQAESLPMFKKALKTHLFKTAYPN